LRLVSLLVLLLLPAHALAQAPPQSGFDAHGFRLAAHDADPRDGLVVARPGRFEEQSWFASGVFEYASQPLVFDTSAGRSVELDDLVAANLSLGYAPHERVRLDLSTPLFFYGEGRSGPIGAGLGDVRATALLSLVAPDEEEGGLGIGFVVSADVPTGRPDLYLGQYTISGGIGVAATYEADALTLTGSASSLLRPSTPDDQRPAPTRGGDAFGWGLSAGYLIGDRTGMTAEIHGEVAVDPVVRTAIGMPAEVLVSFKNIREDGGFLTAGLGVGVSRGAGSSPLRLLVGGGFGQNEGPFRDADGDGLADSEDACPDVPETVNGYKDEDGCRDARPRIELRAIGLDGAVVDSALLKAEGPTTAEDTGILVLEGDSVMPGTTWALSASRGACLAASSTIDLGERGAALELQLQPVHRSRLQIEVVDEAGQPVEGAVVELHTDDAACLPAKPIELQGGVGQGKLGAASYRLVVRAPETAVYVESFAVEAGESHTVRATLRPTKVRVEAEAIVILEKVFFDTGKSTIQEQSFTLLDEIRSVILANELPRVEIGGHTDDRGPDAMNLELSQARAEAVRDYLVAHGVSESVLIAKGYGETMPLEDNRKAAGRSANRRVEFRIGAEEPEPEE